MGNRVRCVDDPLHQLLNLIQHEIRGLSQACQFAFAAMMWQAVREISLHDGRSSLIDVFDLGKKATSNRNAAYYSEKNNDGPGSRKAADEHIFE